MTNKEPLLTDVLSRSHPEYVAEGILAVEEEHADDLTNFPADRETISAGPRRQRAEL